ncbi:MAG TPA: hypothetical protein VGN14_04090, partial [Candidatus Elarobacter sp.]
MRQRNSRRAEELCDEAASLLGTVAPDERRQLQARIDLVRAEGAALLSTTGAAAALVRSARTAFREIGDVVGEGDTHLTDALIAQADGDTERGIVELKAAMHRFEAAGEARRAASTAARLTFNRSIQDPDAARRELTAFATEPQESAAETWLMAARGVVASYDGELARSAAL